LTHKDIIFISILILTFLGFSLHTKDLRAKKEVCFDAFEQIWDQVQEKNNTKK
jgi:hypothetical protein